MGIHRNLVWDVKSAVLIPPSTVQLFEEIVVILQALNTIIHSPWCRGDEIQENRPFVTCSILKG